MSLAVAYSTAVSTSLHTPIMTPQQQGMDRNTGANLISLLLAKSTKISHNKLWSFLKKLNLSRPVADPSSFADGYLVAEIIFQYAPILVSQQEAQRLRWELQQFKQPRCIWHQLTLTALSQLCISMTEDIVTGFEEANLTLMTDFFVVLFQQLDQYLRIQRHFNSYTRQLIADNYEALTARRTLVGETPLDSKSLRPWVNGGKTVLRLTNADYMTTKADVQRFLYPLVVPQAAIHAPIQLSSGKMMYTFFVVMDDTVLPLRAVDLHSGHSLRGRRVEIKVVSINEMLAPFFERGLGSSGPGTFPGRWVLPDMKDRLLKLVYQARHCTASKTPNRIFEHMESLLQILPHGQPDVALTPVEMALLFELVSGALSALLAYLGTQPKSAPARFSVDLLPRIAHAALALPFDPAQSHILAAALTAYESGQPATTVFSSLMTSLSQVQHMTPTLFGPMHVGYVDSSVAAQFAAESGVGALPMGNDEESSSSPMSATFRDASKSNMSMAGLPNGVQGGAVNKTNNGPELLLHPASTRTKSQSVEEQVVAVGEPPAMAAMAALFARRRKQHLGLKGSGGGGGESGPRPALSIVVPATSAAPLPTTPTTATPCSPYSPGYGTNLRSPNPAMSAIEQAFYAATPMSATFPSWISQSATTNAFDTSSPSPTSLSLSTPSAGTSPSLTGAPLAMAAAYDQGEYMQNHHISPEEDSFFASLVPEHVLGRGLWEAL
ncbi:hypothetical protein BC828DRAFT_372358 [Blastocladiella britannica]|nr:hypothetical protein BC828DRAFT_372358 [Blastocladiella britannica]